VLAVRLFISVQFSSDTSCDAVVTVIILTVHNVSFNVRCEFRNISSYMCKAKHFAVGVHIDHSKYYSVHNSKPLNGS